MLFGNALAAKLNISHKIILRDFACTKNSKMNTFVMEILSNVIVYFKRIIAHI